MSLLNLASIHDANITLYYTKIIQLLTGDPDRITFVLNFTGNRVNFLSNDFVYPDGDEN